MYIHTARSPDSRSCVLILVSSPEYSRLTCAFREIVRVSTRYQASDNPIQVSVLFEAQEKIIEADGEGKLVRRHIMIRM
jgi:hypothetical protein